MALPLKLDWDLAQTQWATEINPVLQNPITAGVLLKNITLATGTNTINHKLGRNLQGWFIVRQRAAGTVYDTQDTNKFPALTLTLQSSANISVDLYVF